MSTQTCVDQIIEAAGGKLSRSQVRDLLEDIVNRSDGDPSAMRSPADKIQQAAERLVKDATEAAAIAKRNEIMNLRKKVERRTFYDAAPTPRVALEAKLVGVNTPFAGNRLSVAAQHAAIKTELQGGLFHDLEREGMENLFASRTLEKEWTRELFEINRGEEGQSGITGNAQAKRMAELIHKWQRVSIDAMNREGAWIKSYSGYITKTTHDADKIRRVGQDAWVKETLQRIDVDRTFGAGYAEQGLKDLWVKFKNGDHFQFDDKQVEDIAFRGANMAKRASAHRELHFKSPDDWIAYNASFGQWSPTETVWRSFDTAARTTALMREFGTNPRAAFDADVRFLKDKHATDDAARQDLDRWDVGLRNRFDLLEGSANRPVNAMAARIVGGWMSFQRLAKLGLTPISMLNDLATKASELRYQGLTLPERWGSMFTGYFRGGMNSEKRQVADILHAGLDGRLGMMATRFDAVDTPRGILSRAENMFFRITGITAMTDNQRADAEFMMARHMGMQRGKTWDRIGQQERRILTGFGIEAKEWALLHAADWFKHPESGRTFLTPDVGHKIGDAEMATYLRDTGAISADASEEAVARAIGKGKEDLALKLHAYYADRGQYAILDVGPRERAILMQGARPGTPLGVGLRLLMQFKAFPAAMLTKTWGRELYGGQGRMGAVAGLTEFIVASTVLGVISNGLNQAAKGQDPISQWHNNPAAAFLSGFLKGGAGTIYGDFLFGEFSRFGRTVTGSLAGPTIGQIDALWEIYSKGLRGDDVKGTAVRTIRDNIPFLNMLYTKVPFDYLVMYRIQEAMNPGFLRRMEQRAKTNQGIEYWLKPTSVR